MPNVGPWDSLGFLWPVFPSFIEMTMLLRLRAIGLRRDSTCHIMSLSCSSCFADAASYPTRPAGACTAASAASPASQSISQSIFARSRKARISSQILAGLGLHSSTSFGCCLGGPHLVADVIKSRAQELQPHACSLTVSIQDWDQSRSDRRPSFLQDGVLGYSFACSHVGCQTGKSHF